MNVVKWIRLYYNKVTGSIAFYPALIAIGFLLLSWGLLEIDFSEWGKGLKSNLSWLSLKDASTARTIIGTVAAAIISLTVFSFSMVMIVLNQAASQMSNRVLTSMIENRFQQIVLGFYIGTTVYALFLLSTIRDISSGVYIPALSIYILILLTVVDIFLFIYFLDYVTRTVKYETVIDRIKNQTLQTMKKQFEKISEEEETWNSLPFTEVKVAESNYLQQFDEKRLLNIAAKENLYISFLYKRGTYLIKGCPFIRVYSTEKINEDCIKQILLSIDFFSGQPIYINADYGFKQLAEIAIKALSPGINDPGTAVLSLHSLTELLAFKQYYNLPSVLVDDKNLGRIYIPNYSFIEMFEECIHPIWKYGKNDVYIQKELLQMISQLKIADDNSLYIPLLDAATKMVEEYTINNNKDWLQSKC